MTDPAITLEGFFERARDGELTGLRCRRCGELTLPPREFCPSCRERAWESMRLSGEGTIATYTIIRVAPRAHAAEAPYAVAVVRLREGLSLFGRVVGVPLDRLAIGLPVRFRPLLRGSDTVVAFEPA